MSFNLIKKYQVDLKIVNGIINDDAITNKTKSGSKI